jgi:hypothetical protein
VKPILVDHDALRVFAQRLAQINGQRVQRADAVANVIAGAIALALLLHWTAGSA